jgi:hypothetical protein
MTSIILQRMAKYRPKEGLLETEKYRLSFTIGGLFVNESTTIAQLHVELGDWEKVLQKALDDRVFMLPKTASNRRTAREVVSRLRFLTDREVHLLATGADRKDAQNVLWVACCRAYQFIREFTIEVIVDRFQTYRIDLPFEVFDIFWEEKANQHSELLRVGASTKSKLRQVLFRLLREAGLIDERNRIQNMYLSTKFVSLIESEQPNNLMLFPHHG